ncbi:hypothetical protein Hypma_006746 [Hypsizygus marmoreus]|uniref:Uncharacterized protein n=1 Tax=Hypsizygus marmoreus TaxID=39966 RepID=A0A369K625_HYPMA|nr:hypothetical protein Hypma_006746 [Hypsizygus marmoreus]
MLRFGTPPYRDPTQLGQGTVAIFSVNFLSPPATIVDILADEAHSISRYRSAVRIRMLKIRRHREIRRFKNIS